MALVGVAMSSFVMFDTDTTSEADDQSNARDAEPEPEVIRVDAFLNEEAGDTHSDQASATSANDTPLARFGARDDDMLTGANGNDLLDGQAGNDTIIAGGGDDILQGGAGDDTLRGDNGDDRLMGHADNDMLDGGAGDDALFGGTGDDVLNGGAGDDQLDGYLGADTLFGGAGEDVLFGGADDDVLNGRGDGKTDTLLGGSGDDVLIAGNGDHMTGGSGMDVFNVNQNAVIHDFDPDEDSVEVVYENDMPTLTTQVSDAGLVLLADGAVVATFSKLAQLDMASVDLVRA